MSETKNRFSRRDFVVLSSSVVASQVLASKVGFAKDDQTQKSSVKSVKKNSKRPNILFVFTDQERFITHWPTNYRLPGHEKLKNKGVQFNSHYVSASMCTSSRSVMLTGLQTADNGMFDNVDCPYIKSLSTKIPTVGHMLRKAGYQTAYLGKWHLGQEFGGHYPEKSLVARMDEYGFGDFFSPGDGMAHTLGGYESDELIGASALSWLRRKGRVLNDENKPWSLFVSLVNPHDIMYFNADGPGENIQDTGRLLMKAARAPESAIYSHKWRYGVPKNLRQPMSEAGRPTAHGEYLKAWASALGTIPLRDENWQRLSDFYFNSIAQVDRQISLLLAELENLGLADNTVVVFTSDHGEMGGHHGLRGKGPFAYEEVIHVPFYMIHPDVKGGQSCQALSSHIDIAPTLLSLAGVDKTKSSEFAQRELPGRDLSGALSNPTKAGIHAVRDQVLFTYSGIATNDSEMVRLIAEAKAAGKDPKVAVKQAGYKPNLQKRGTLRSVFDGRYKFTRYFSPTAHHKVETLDQLYANNDVELFDLKSDPSEMTNIAKDRSKNADHIAAMSQKLESAIKNEIGKDNGREMPAFPGVEWSLEKIDL